METHRSNESRRNTPPADAEAAQLALQVAAFCPLGLLLSCDRRIVWCNERFATQFGYTREALQGLCLAVLYPSDVEFERIGDRGLKVMMVSGEYRDERLMRKRDGALEWFRVHGRTHDVEHPFATAIWTFEALGSGVNTSRLTPREREVLADMARGLTAKECGKALGISPRTVEKLRNSLREKYGVKNATELMTRVSGLPTVAP